MKTLKIKKRATTDLAMIFCSLIILSTIGSTFGISNSVAQLETQSPSTITYKQSPSTITYKQSPSTITYKQSAWNNNLPSTASKAQPLCEAGICSHSSDSASRTTGAQAKTQPLNTAGNSTNTPTNSAQPTTTKPQNTVSSSATTPTSSAQPTTKTLTQTFTTNRTPTLFHSFFSSYTVGADRFRFIKSYWTSSDVAPPNLLSGLPTTNTPCPGLQNSPFSLQPQALNTEVDKDEGYATLAVILQYQGVAPLTGIAAGLKLPAGFQAQLPLETDSNNYNVALSNYVGLIPPGQAITLCFPLNILSNAKVQLPVLGPLALHFLRVHPRTLVDTIDATKMESAMRSLQFANGKNTTTFNNNFNSPPSGSGSITFTYNNEFDRNIPFDYINQVLPIIFKVTGREILDVSLPPNETTPPITAFPPVYNLSVHFPPGEGPGCAAFHKLYPGYSTPGLPSQYTKQYRHCAKFFAIARSWLCSISQTVPWL